MKWLQLLVAILMWSVVAWAFIFVFAGAHVCAVLSPIGGGPLTTEEMAQQIANCDRPDIGAIIVFSVGYLVLAGVAVWMFVTARAAR
jgi:hypothetical protein